MILTILCIWVLLTFPLLRTTLKQLEERGIEERKTALFQTVLMFSCMWHVPQYYFLVTIEFLEKIIKRK